MPQFVLTYLGGNPPASPEEAQENMQRFRAWLAELGDAAVSPANPLKGTCTVAPDGSVTEGGSSGMSGYTIVEAADMDAALGIAKACPFLDVGGSLEVSEKIQMS